MIKVKKYFKKLLSLVMVLAIVLTTESFINLSEVVATPISKKSTIIDEDEESSITTFDVEKEDEEEKETPNDNDDKENNNKENDDTESYINAEADNEKNKSKDSTKISTDSDAESNTIDKNTNNENELENKAENTHSKNKTSTNSELIKTPDENKKQNENDIEETKKEKISETVSSDSELDSDTNEEDSTIENETVATTSIIDDENISTVSEVKEYKELTTLEQINFEDKDAAILYNDTIKLEKDIILSDAIYFRGDINLDLAGHTITGPKDNVALYIENNFVLTNSSDDAGKITASSNDFPTIYIEGADVEILGGAIYGANGNYTIDKASDINGGDAIHLTNSNLLIENAIIYGGNGLESDDGKGGDGGTALVVIEAKKDNTITIKTSSLTGGSGGNGISDSMPSVGSALKINGRSFEDQYFGKGLSGNIGGGSGGTAIDIRTKDFSSKNLYYDEYSLNAGHAGFSKNEDINIESIENILTTSYIDSDDELFGAGPNSSIYSLHNLDGKNYLTSIKSQGTTGLCVPFAATAYAETALIKNYPDYVKNVLGKDIDKTLDRSTWKTNSDEFNLSEIYMGMQLQVQSKDEFGNAGLSKYTYNIANEIDWAGIGAEASALAKALTTWRPIVEEDNDISWTTADGISLLSNAINRNLLNNYNNKTVAHAKDAIIHSAKDFCNGADFDRERFISQLKRDIVKYSGVALFIYTGGKRKFATFADGTNAYTSSDGIKYGDYVMSLGVARDFEKTDRTNLGAHSMYCIGWDNKVTFTDDRGEHTGAFICKNSWGLFTLVPFDTAWAFYYKEDADDGNTHIPNYFMEYVAIDFTPSFSEYENIYYYDSGVGTETIVQSDSQGVKTLSSVESNVGTYGEVTYTMNANYSSIVNTFEIRNDKEKIKAVSAYIEDEGVYKVTLYKVTTLENETTLLKDLKDSNIKTSETLTLNRGYNFIPLTDEVDFIKGSKIAVKIERIDKDYFGTAQVDSNIDRTYYDTVACVYTGTKYETVHKGRSFFTDLHVKMIETENNGNKYYVGDVDFENMVSLKGDAVVNSVKNTNSNKLTKFEDGKNARIRLITNNYIKVDANGKGSFDGGAVVLYVYPILRTELGNIIEPVPGAATDAFEIYNTKADGTGDNYDAASIYKLKIGDALTLYAKWINATSYAVLSFNPGEGSGTMAEMKRAIGSSVKVPTSSFSKIGYVFDGWVDETGAEVLVSHDLTLNRDITLTAKWKENEFSITYELNDGEFESGYVNYNKKRLFSTDVELPDSSKLHKEGYLFAGWYDNEDLNGTSYTRTRAANTETTYDFYAKWEPVKYTIEYDPNGGTVRPKSFTKTYGEDVDVLAVPTKKLDKFLGWYIDSAFTKLYDKKDLSTTNDDKKYLYAKWEHVKVTTFNFKTEHGSNPSEQYIEDNKKVTEPNVGNVIGYKLLYWYENYEDVKFNFDDVISAEGERTRILTAKWQAITYKITLNVGDGTINEGNLTEYTYGIGATLPTNVKPKYTDLRFDGWYEKEDFSGDKIVKISKTDYGNKTYYAHYIKESYSGKPSGGTTGGTGGNGGGSGGSAGAYTGGELQNNLNPLSQPKAEDIRDTTIGSSLKSIPVNYNTSDSVWTSDEEGYRHLSIKGESGEMVEAKNVFACIVTPHVDAKGDKFEVEDFYYLDTEGKMYTGWLKDVEKTTYYFESTAGSELGKLSRGWTKIGADHYYFDGTGTLQTNTTTPDGFNVDATGKWIENNVKNDSSDTKDKNQKVETTKKKVGITLSK